MNKYLDCLRLNCRVAWLAVRGKWLSRHDLAASYDRIAPTYDERWFAQLEPVTRSVLKLLPEPAPGPILDLGCGTGHSSVWLAQRFERPVLGVDISKGMLAQAALHSPPGVEFQQGDMLETLAQQPNESVSLIFSGWAMGYSRYAEVVAQAARALAPGGIFAYVVNLADTLAPVFRAYRQCMARHPGSLNRVTLPGFPKSHQVLLRELDRHGLEILEEQNGQHPICPPDGEDIGRWLMGTGVLAGFDVMLPMPEQGEVAASFNTLLAADPTPIRHHYSLAVCRKKE